MRFRMPVLIALSASGLLFFGCSQVYTQHLNENYKGKKLASVSFGIVSLPELYYTEPSSCFGNNNSDLGPTYRTEWETKLIKTLSFSFKKQRFVSIDEARLKALGMSTPALYSTAEADIASAGVEEYESQGGNKRPLAYIPSRSNGKMQALGTRLKEKDSIDYIIVLVDPKMSGETHYVAGSPGVGGAPGTAGGTQTIYTANVRFGIWSAETGELLYASGSIAASSGFCVFQSPQSGSIGGNTEDMSTQLKSLISAFLIRLSPERLEVGQATGIESSNRIP